jgi:ABC-2 type transport system permease protein
MIPTRWQPLAHLVDARIREFLREPEVIFWVYGFPLILAFLLGFAFRSVEPTPPTVDVQSTPDLERAKEVAALLNKESWGAEKPKVEVLSEEECKRRALIAESALYLVAHSDKIEYHYDPMREESVRARYWTEALLSRKNAGKNTPEPQYITEKGRRYIDRLLPALVATNIMGGGLFGIGFVLVDMRVRKLFKRIMATPMRHSDFLLSLLVSRLLFLFPEMTSLLLVGTFWFEVPIKGSLITLAIIMFFGAIAFSGIGMLIGSRTEKTETATGWLNLVMLPQYILSGVFFSVTNFPVEVQPFIQALPLTQLIDAMREVMLEGKGFLDVAWRIAILGVYAVVCFALALRWFKWR